MISRPSHILLTCLFASYSLCLAELKNEGHVGGPFSGTGNDSSGSITLQFGSTADLTHPNGLVVAPERNRLRSGTTTGLNASLLLDDDTYTVLDPTEVSWSFDKPNLSIEGGKLIADILPERTDVRVEATAEGFTASFTIFILADKDLVAELEKSTLPVSLRDAIVLEAKGWSQSDWFGVFYNAQNGWLYHIDMGWLHITEGTSESAWFWNDNNQWVWTGRNIYPHLYRNRDAAWLYFFKQALPNKVFYNYNTEKLEHFSDK